MFGLDQLDRRLAAGRSRRAICQVCQTGFDTDGSAICADCIGLELTPLQDNEDPFRSGFAPREPAEISVFRLRAIQAELQAYRYRLAVRFLHQIVGQIAGAKDKPLRLFPRDQHRVAELALEQFRDNFADLVEIMDLAPESSLAV